MVNNKQCIFTKEEAIEFAKKYLEVRKMNREQSSCPDDDPFWVWKIATEYVLLDIIPYLYGEALD